MSQNNMTLQDKRDIVLSKVSEKYDFSANVEDFGGWEYTVPGNEYIRSVYLENNEEPDGDTVEVKLVVVFKDNSDEIESVYAYNDSGNIFGKYKP